jgi:lysozyme
MKKGYFITVLITIILILIVGILWLYRYYYMPKGIEIDKTRYPITGIDVSAHSGKIDFDTIKKQNIDFVYIKATEGGDYVDKNYKTNYVNAKQRGIPVGFYHFFRFNVSGKKQADNFLQAIQGNITNLPLVLDVEEWGNKTKKQPKEIIKEIECFVKEIEVKGNDSIMFYTNEKGFWKYIRGNFEKNKIWICSFSKQPDIDKIWTFWQHSHKGKLKGAEGLVDINTFNGSREEWDSYIKNVSVCSDENGTGKHQNENGEK